MNDLNYFSIKFSDEEFRDKAEKELGEKADEVTGKIKHLRQLVNDCDNILPTRIDDAFLLRFLRVKKFDVDKSFKMVKILVLCSF